MISKQMNKNLLMLTALAMLACVPPEAETIKKDGSANSRLGGTQTPISNTGGSVSPTGGQGGALSSGGTTSVSSSDAGKGGTTTDTAPLPTNASCQTGCAKLPVVVDGENNFAASGYMGDWKAGAILDVTSTINPDACNPQRAHPTAVGKCHHFTWKFSGGICPLKEDPEQKCGQWACVAWLRPHNLYTEPTNPGKAGGLAIAPGATKVQFWAWAPAATMVRFSVGSATEGVSQSLTVSLTTTPTQFEFDISMASYNIVNTGFQWCAAETGATSVDFFVDDIQWM